MAASMTPLVRAPEGFEYDLSGWPIFVTLRHTTPSDLAYAEHIRVLDTLLARAEPQVHIIEVLATGAASRAQMKVQADWNDRNREALTRHCLGVGMVLHNAFQRFGIAAMLSLTRQPVPYQVFASRPEALGWARSLLNGKRTKAQ